MDAELGLLSAHVRAVHFEDGVDGSADVLIAFDEEEGVDAVDGLGDVGHGDLVGVAVEDVEGERGVQRVTQGERLAEQVVGRDLFADGIPDAPLVYHKLGVMLGIVFGHDGPVLFDDGFDTGAFAQNVKPAAGVEGGDALLGFAEVGVVVDGEAVDAGGTS